jgi:hypothetical protein
MDDDPLADFLAKRRDALIKMRKTMAQLERFKKEKGRAPATLAELQNFLIEERLKGKQS